MVNLAFEQYGVASVHYDKKIFATCSHWRKFYHTNFLSCVKDCIEDNIMVTFISMEVD